MDRATFPDRALPYSNDYFMDGDKYKGLYTDPGTEYDGVEVDGNTITIKMDKPFPDMPYWGAFPANGPIPEGKDSDPDKYRLHPWSTGPYMIDEYTPEKSLTLVQEPALGPGHRPGPYAVPGRVRHDFKTAATPKIDQIMLADQGEAQTTLTYDDVLAEDFRTFQNDHEDRLVLGGPPCTSYWAPDNRKITDKKVRQALACAYPYKDAALAAGLIRERERASRPPT